MKLYTKTGDDGTTGLFGGPRVLKCDPRVHAYGEVDELNAAIGCAIAACSVESVKQKLTAIQSDLFTVGAELATPPGGKLMCRVDVSSVAVLERWIDEAVAPVPPLRNFILPGGTSLAAQLHVCRTVCRRAERAVVAPFQGSSAGGPIIVYLNRLSDFLFALARLENHVSRVAENPWSAPRPD